MDMPPYLTLIGWASIKWSLTRVSCRCATPRQRIPAKLCQVVKNHLHLSKITTFLLVSIGTKLFFPEGLVGVYNTCGNCSQKSVFTKIEITTRRGLHEIPSMVGVMDIFWNYKLAQCG